MASEKEDKLRKWIRSEFKGGRSENKLLAESSFKYHGDNTLAFEEYLEIAKDEIKCVKNEEEKRKEQSLTDKNVVVKDENSVDTNDKY